jgi:Tfp pilus assembly protein PilV
MRRAQGLQNRRRQADRGATLIEALIAMVLCGIIVVGLMSALRTSVRSGRTTSEQASLQGALADAAQLLDRVQYVRCPSTDPARTYQAEIEKAMTNAGSRIASISIVTVDFWMTDAADWESAPTSTTLVPTTAPTTTNPMATTVVPSVTTIESVTTTTEVVVTVPSGTSTTVDGGAIDPGPTTTVDPLVTTSADPGPTAPPTTDLVTTTTVGPLGFGSGDLDAIKDELGRLSSNDLLIGRTATGLIRAVDCAGPEAGAGTGPLQRIRLRAVTGTGAVRDLVVVKTDD